MRRLAILGTLSFLAACTAGTTRPRDGAVEETGDAQCSDGLDGDGDGLTDCADPSCAGSCGGDGGPRPDGGFVDCVADPYTAELAYKPVDIVWVVDNSGSMSDEADAVQQNIDDFAAAIGMVGLDWHVVMITTAAFVSAPEPLASDPRYLFLETDVQSNEPLQELLDNLPRYRDHLRRSASLHFVAVTDDESALPWESFRDQMRAALGYGFIFHTISSERVTGGGIFNPDGACTTPGGSFGDGAAAAGDEYWALALATGGLTFSICTPPAEWVSLFDTLTEAVAVPMLIPCEYEIPDPPAGGTLDYGYVNILYTPSSGTPTRFPYAQTSDGVNCLSGGWYYDDPSNPTRIILCPNSCTLISMDSDPRVDVELGCASLLI